MNLFSFSRTKGWPLLKRFMREYVWPHKKMLAAGIACMIVSAITTVVLAQYLRPIFDDIFIGHKRDALIYISIGVFFVFLFKGLSAYGEHVAMDVVGQKIVISLQEKLFAHIITLDVPFFHAHHGGALLSHLTNDVGMLRSLAVTAFVNLVREFFTLAGLVVLIIKEDALLAAIALAGFPIAAAPIILCGRKMRKISFQTQEITASLYTFFTQVFQGICLVKASGMEREEAKTLRQKEAELCEKVTKAVRVRELVHPFMEVLSGIAIVMVLLYGGWQVIQGTRSAGGFMTFIAALLLAYRPLKSLIQMNNQLQEGLAAATRVFSIFEKRPVIEASKGVGMAMKTPRQEIIFDNVHFSYPSTSDPLFQGFSCRFPVGKRLALVGPSGSGKTTLFYLMLRFYNPDQGQILIDGVDTRMLEVQSLRKHIALVSQDIVLFDTTVLENIRYGSPEATLKQVKEAAKLAFADEFIDTLPNTYDTFIGENGVRLSGGQRQRIALARAFLRDAPLLLLDEATAALDTASEKKVQQALFRLMEGRTSIIIAHRLSTIFSSDLIYVMRKGALIEEGTHADLLKVGGLYSHLVSLQEQSGARQM